MTREQLRTALWPADTFVDFDTGLNTVIKRLREVLRDSAEELPIHRNGTETGLPIHRSSAGRGRAAAGRRSAPEIRAHPRLDKMGGGRGRPAGRLRYDVFYFSRGERQSGATVEVVPLTGRSEMEDSPAFSPDGNQVAFKSSNAVPDGSEGLIPR